MAAEPEECAVCGKPIPPDRMREHYAAEHKRTDTPCGNCGHAIGNHVARRTKSADKPEMQTYLSGRSPTPIDDGADIPMGCRECMKLGLPVCMWVFDKDGWTTRPP